MENLIRPLTGTMSSLSNTSKLNAANNQNSAQRQYGKQLEDYARKIYAQEFMYELRGDNQNLRNDLRFASVKDQGSRELSKTA
jgi:hypothetical protein